MKKIVAALGLVLVVMLAACGCQQAAPRPLPGVSLDPNNAKDEWAGRDEIAEAASEPYLFRTPDETLAVSRQSACRLAQKAGQYADILGKCKVLDASSGTAETARLKLNGSRLYVLHAEDHRHAARLRLQRPDGTIIPVKRVDVDSSALDIMVADGAGAKGEIVVTTQSDGSLPDTERLPLGQLTLYVSK